MVEFSKGVGYCVLTNAILCSYRKSAKSGLMNRCFSCPHYERFNREMEEEEEFWEEVEKIRGAECCCICARKLDSDNRSDVWNVCVRCKKTLEM
jgi:hypothetical protein